MSIATRPKDPGILQSLQREDEWNRRVGEIDKKIKGLLAEKKALGKKISESMLNRKYLVNRPEYKARNEQV